MAYSLNGLVRFKSIRAILIIFLYPVYRIARGLEQPANGVQLRKTCVHDSAVSVRTDIKKEVRVPAIGHLYLFHKQFGRLLPRVAVVEPLESSL